ncbi:MAG: 50S ribosomal protein L3 N(5)-glutamine methyltransferase [Pseudomonadota bacterium]
MTESKTLIFPQTDATGAQWVAALTEAFDQAGLFFGHGTDNPQDEATWLVAAAARIDYASDQWADQLETVLREPLPRSLRTTIQGLAERRIAEKVPLAYLLKQAWFCGYRFFVDERVLVPRSPIGRLIESSFAPWKAADGIERMLDLCTGSGCIAVAAALQLPGVQVDATDLSSDALAVAAQNIEMHSMAERVTLYEGDLFAALPAHSQYDLIVTNPPYVDAEEMRARPAEFLAEPELGLAAGSDGLDIARRILSVAADFLKPGGVLIMEVGASDDALQAAYPTVPFTWWLSEDWGYGILIMDREALVAHADALVRNDG